MPTRILRDWTDSYAFDELSAEAERLFTRLIMKVDDFARYYRDPRLIRANCFPLSESIKVKEVDQWVQELIKRKLVMEYTSKSVAYIAVPKFRQRSRASNSKFPAPDGCPVDWTPPDEQEPTMKPTVEPESPNQEEIPKITKRMEQSRVVLHKLNELTGRTFRETDKNLSMIAARLAEADVTVEGCVEMIKRQVDRWSNDAKMSEFLRPETLFNSTKFDSYYASRLLPVGERPAATNSRNGSIAGSDGTAAAIAERERLHKELAESEEVPFGSRQPDISTKGSGLG